MIFMADEKKIDIIKSSRPFKMWDIIAFGAIIALLAVFFLLSFRIEGDSVRILYEGKNSDYPLHIDREIVLADKLTIVISDSKVYVKESDCPDKVCMHSGVIARANQTIVCAPFGIVIKIISSKSDWI